jgi:hypothetical protein
MVDCVEQAGKTVTIYKLQVTKKQGNKETRKSVNKHGMRKGKIPSFIFPAILQ